jgi:hypothetical protein
MPRDRVTAILESANHWDSLEDEPGTTGDQILAVWKRRGVQLDSELSREVAEFVLDMADKLDERPLGDRSRRLVLFSLSSVLNSIAWGGTPDTNPLIGIHLRRALRLMGTPDEATWPEWLLRAAE